MLLSYVRDFFFCALTEMLYVLFSFVMHLEFFKSWHLNEVKPLNIESWKWFKFINHVNFEEKYEKNMRKTTTKLIENDEIFALDWSSMDYQWVCGVFCSFYQVLGSKLLENQ